MLDPITHAMTDESTGTDFCFTFCCDICESPWQSVPLRFRPPKSAPDAENHANKLLWQSEHAAAYERANHEAMQHFNRCPICKRWVCDDCFRIMKDRDVCKSCAGILR